VVVFNKWVCEVARVPSWGSSTLTRPKATAGSGYYCIYTAVGGEGKSRISLSLSFLYLKVEEMKITSFAWQVLANAWSKKLYRAGGTSLS
jgi:hypothetical protein